MEGHSATGMCLSWANSQERRGTVEPVSKRILRTSSFSPRCTILVITGTGPLVGKGQDSVHLPLKCLEAVCFEGHQSSFWLSLESSSSALDRERFFVIAMVWSPAVRCRSPSAGRGDLKENLACRCPDIPNRTLPPRPFSGRLRFSRPFSVWPQLLHCCLPLSPALSPGSFSFRQQMLFWSASSEGEAISCLWMWFGRNMLLSCVHPFRIFGSRLCSFSIRRPRPPGCLSLLP